VCVCVCLYKCGIRERENGKSQYKTMFKSHQAMSNGSRIIAEYPDSRSRIGCTRSTNNEFMILCKKGLHLSINQSRTSC